jgi:hypothetical protein
MMTTAELAMHAQAGDLRDTSAKLNADYRRKEDKGLGYEEPTTQPSPPQSKVASATSNPMTRNIQPTGVDDKHEMMTVEETSRFEGDGWEEDDLFSMFCPCFAPGTSPCGDEDDTARREMDGQRRRESPRVVRNGQQEIGQRRGGTQKAGRTIGAMQAGSGYNDPRPSAYATQPMQPRAVPIQLQPRGGARGSGFQMQQRPVVHQQHDRAAKRGYFEQPNTPTPVSAYGWDDSGPPEV